MGGRELLLKVLVNNVDENIICIASASSSILLFSLASYIFSFFLVLKIMESTEKCRGEKEYIKYFFILNLSVYKLFTI